MQLNEVPAENGVLAWCVFVLTFGMVMFFAGALYQLYKDKGSFDRLKDVYTTSIEEAHKANRMLYQQLVDMQNEVAEEGEGWKWGKGGDCSDR